jgi:hypothetical protein
MAIRFPWDLPELEPDWREEMFARCRRIRDERETGPIWLREKQAAAFLGISKYKLARMRRDGSGPAFAIWHRRIEYDQHVLVIFKRARDGADSTTSAEHVRSLMVTTLARQSAIAPRLAKCVRHSTINRIRKIKARADKIRRAKKSLNRTGRPAMPSKIAEHYNGE